MELAPDEPRCLTKDEAIVWILAWAETSIPKYNRDYQSSMRNHITSGVAASWMQGLVDELIDRIRNGTEDPITEVAMYYYEMGDIIERSDDDHVITHRFAGFMEEWSHCILSYLKKKEQEMYEYERRRIQQKKH